MSLRQLTGAVGVICVVGLSAAGNVAAHSSGVRGTWTCCGAGGAAAQTWTLTSDAGSGHGRGGSYTWPMTGSVSGRSVRLTTGPYNELPSYTAVFVGTISADGNTMSGTWKDNGSQSGTWTATRIGSGGGGSTTQPTAPLVAPDPLRLGADAAAASVRCPAGSTCAVAARLSLPSETAARLAAAAAAAERLLATTSGLQINATFDALLTDLGGNPAPRPAGSSPQSLRADARATAVEISRLLAADRATLAAALPTGGGDAALLATLKSTIASIERSLDSYATVAGSTDALAPVLDGIVNDPSTRTYRTYDPATGASRTVVTQAEVDQWAAKNGIAVADRSSAAYKRLEQQLLEAYASSDPTGPAPEVLRDAATKTIQARTSPTGELTTVLTQAQVDEWARKNGIATDDRASAAYQRAERQLLEAHGVFNTGASGVSDPQGAVGLPAAIDAFETTVTRIEQRLPAAAAPAKGTAGQLGQLADDLPALVDPPALGGGAATSIDALFDASFPPSTRTTSGVGATAGVTSLVATRLQPAAVWRGVLSTSPSAADRRAFAAALSLASAPRHSTTRLRERIVLALALTSGWKAATRQHVKSKPLGSAQTVLQPGQRKRITVILSPNGERLLPLLAILAHSDATALRLDTRIKRGTKTSSTHVALPVGAR